MAAGAAYKSRTVSFILEAFVSNTRTAALRTSRSEQAEHTTTIRSRQTHTLGEAMWMTIRTTKEAALVLKTMETTSSWVHTQMQTTKMMKSNASSASPVGESEDPISETEADSAVPPGTAPG